MKSSTFKKALFVALGVGCSFGAGAREIAGLPSTKNGGKSGFDGSGKLAAVCATATSKAQLDINNVRAMVLNGGDMWWNLSDAQYEVPKVDDPNLPKKHSLFAGAVWLGGQDAGQLLLCTQTFRQVLASSGPQIGYWPGPLNDIGITDDKRCAAWDYHAKIDKAVIDQFADDFVPGQTSQNDVPRAILEWPAKGNPYITNANANMNQNLAPFTELPGQEDGIYDPLQGDLPAITGDQAIWWVMNDHGGGAAKNPLTPAIGLELQVMAFGFQTNDLINNMTFYKQTLLNKGSRTLTNTFLGQWVDPDLGFYNDDYVGCDVARGLGICYNGDDLDEGVNGYGLNPPAIGVDFFKGPVADPNDGVDNDRDGITDEGTDGVDNDGDGTTDEADEAELIIMSSFVYYNNSSDVKNGDPRQATDFYNYLRSIWKHNVPLTFGGNGLDASTPPYKFMFPGNTDKQGWGYVPVGSTNPPGPTPPYDWSEYNTNGAGGKNTPSDRRFLQSAGPFTLAPGSVNELVIGAVWARANTGGSRGSFGLLLNADDKAQSLFDNDFKLRSGPEAHDLTASEFDREIILALTPRTFTTSEGNVVTTETYFESDNSLRAKGVTDPVYRFEGVKVYQLRNSNVTASELNDPSQARLLAQGDVVNGITNLINYEFDAEVNQGVPTLKVEGNDKGVFHTLRVTNDLFATGDSRLVNFKTYHYMVVAYAQNSDTANIEEPYLEGRKVSKVSAIPHKTQPEQNGMVLNSAYGSGLRVFRIFGTGNGGNVLEITEKDEQDIIASPDYSKLRLEYEAGKTPISIKVYDPKLVKPGNFNVKMSSRLVYRAGGPRVQPGDEIVSTGQFTTAESAVDTAPKDTMTTPNKLSRFPQIPGRAIVKRVVSEQMIGTELYITLEIQMLNDMQGGTFVAAIDKFTNRNAQDPGAPDPDVLVGYDTEERPFKVVSTNDNYTATEFKLHDYWTLTDPTGRQVRGDRTISEFNEQLLPDYGIALQFNHANNPGYQPTLNQINGFQEASLTFSGPQRWLAGVTSKATTQWLQKEEKDNQILKELDPYYVYTKVLNGTWAPYAVTTQTASIGPAYNQSIPRTRKLYDLQNVDIVITSDKSKWTRVPVLQENNSNPNVRLTKRINNVASTKKSVNKDGGEDNSVSPYRGQPSTNMGWFPGYAIDLDRGIRLNMMFAESSRLPSANGLGGEGPVEGTDLIWKPTSQVNGGLNFVYVMTTKYDEGRNLEYRLDSAAAMQVNTLHNNLILNLFNEVMWVGNPRLETGSTYLANDARVRLRVNRYYTSYPDPATVNNANTNPEYEFSTDAAVPLVQNLPVAKKALDLVRVVPNPYYGTSQYENRQLDNIVKITNLPKECKISIYTLNGTLVRQLRKDDNRTFIDWNMKNAANLPIASGTYIIHVDAGDKGETVLKWFGILRPIDLNTF